MRTYLKPLLLALSIAAGTAMTAHAQTAPSYTIPSDGTLLNVSAEAEAKRVPDIATLSAGVVTQAADGNAAMRQNAEQMSKVMAAVKAAGIADKDVQTSGINLSPQYTYKENEAPKINGYQASNTVNLKVRDITRLGKVLDALVAQGANNINGPSFSIDQPEPVYDEARVAALKKAQARAETYAKSLGLKVRPHCQHLRRPQRRCGAPDDDGRLHALGQGRDGHPGRSRREHAVDQPRCDVRTGALRALV